MAFFNRLRLKSKSQSGSGSGFETSYRATGSIANRVRWDTRQLVPGQDSGTGSKPWDSITPTDALQYPAWYRACMILSTSVFGMEIDVKEIVDEQGSKKMTEAYDHPAYWPICIQANEEETAQEARCRMTWIRAQYGAAYAGILRRSGKPIEIIPFAPYQCWPERINGQKWYIVDPYRSVYANPYQQDPSYQPDITKMRKLLPSDVIDLSNPSDDGFYPMETWFAGRMAIHEGVAGSKIRSARASNSGRPRVALTTPQALNEKTVQRIREEFPIIHQGIDDQVVPAILDCDLKPTSIPYQPEYTAESVLHGLNLREISNLTGVPSTFLGDPDSRSYNAFEYDVKNFYEWGIGPYLNNFENQYKAKMLAAQERKRKSICVSFDRQTTKFADTKTMAELIRALGAGAPIATINEIRQKLFISASDDPEAKKLYFPKNMGAGGADNQTTNPNKKNPGNPGRNVETIIEVPEVATPPIGGATNRNASILVVRKIVKRMANESSSRSKVERSYMDFVGQEIETKYREYVLSDLNELAKDGGVFEGKNVNAIADKFIAECKDQLLEMAGMAKKGQLESVVKSNIELFSDKMPARFMEILEG